MEITALTLVMMALAVAAAWAGWRLIRALDSLAQAAWAVALRGVRADEASWRGAVEQAVADATGEAVRVSGFLGLGRAEVDGAQCWSLRFSAGHGREVAFTSVPAGLPGARGRPVEISPATQPIAHAEIHAVWEFFARRTEHELLAVRAPRGRSWWLSVLEERRP